MSGDSKGTILVVDAQRSLNLARSSTSVNSAHRPPRRLRAPCLAWLSASTPC